MKILTAMYTMKKGGAYHRFLMMIETFLERGWEVHCLSLTPIQMKHSFFHNHALNFPFKTVDSSFARLAVFLIFPLWSFWIGWKNRIDLIIAFGSLYAFMLSLSKYILNRPMVTLIRGNIWFGSQVQNSSRCYLYLIKSIENIGIRFSNRIITNNEASRSEILRKKADVQVLYNNIPSINIHDPADISKIRDRYGIPNDAKVLITAGIISRGKNIGILINCLSQIALRNIFLLIAGDASTEADYHYKVFLKGLAKKLGVNQQVIFTGWLEKGELLRIYQSSDLFVLPSLNEGMPNAMLEALESDLPCIGSNIPGVKDILKYDELIFPPMDDKSLANKIELFFSDHHFSDRVKRLCQERKGDFLFDWKEKLFQLVTQGTFHRGGACQSK